MVLYLMICGPYRIVLDPIEYCTILYVKIYETIDRIESHKIFWRFIWFYIGWYVDHIGSHWIQ